MRRFLSYCLTMHGAGGSAATSVEGLEAATIAPPELRVRIIAGALTCFGRWGLAKTTLDDIARAGGCSRASVYRTFPGGKPAIAAAVALHEVVRLTDDVTAAVSGADDLADAVVQGMVTAARRLQTHDTLQYLLRHEPDSVQPFLAFDRLNPLLAMGCQGLAPALRRFVDGHLAEEIVEWAVRMVLSYTFNPWAQLQLDQADDVARLVNTYLMPGVADAVPTP